MSYVLDALRRAEAERHNHPADSKLPAVAAPSRPAAPPRRPERTARAPLVRGLVMGMGLALLVLAALVWRPGLRPHGAPAAIQPATTTAPSPAQEPVPASASMAIPDPTPMAARASPPTSEHHLPVPAQTSGTPAAWAPPPGPLLQPQPVPIERPTAVPTAATIQASAPRPPLVISGVTYSERADHRMLIVNGRVVQEGQEVAPGHRLEAIGPRSAVIQQGVTRYNVNY